MVPNPGLFLSAIGISSFALVLNASIEKNEFSQVNNLVVDLYGITVQKKLNGNLELNEKWDNYGGAFQVDSVRKPLGEERYLLTLTGDIPRNPFINIYAYAIVACHEMGHLLSVGPKSKKVLVSWSSVEGEADYFVGQCMFQLIEKLGLSQAPFRFNRHSANRCDNNFGEDGRKFLACLQIMSGIMSMQDYFNSTSSNINAVSICRHDDTVVEKTREKYPSNQCRIDTMKAGLFGDPRPSCWYKA